MKLFVFIGLICVLPAMGIRPSLAFHFCGGSFHSAGIGHAGSGCCGGGMEETPDGATGETAAFSELAEPCCSGYTLDISTDTFRIPSAVSALPALHPANSFFLPPSSFSPAEDYALQGLRRQTVFPPGHSLYYTSDRLALICIWRK